MDGIVPTLALLLLVAFAVAGLALLGATYVVHRGAESRTQVNGSHWVALVSLVASLPALGLSLLLSNTALGWMPTVISLAAVGWSAAVLRHTTRLRREPV